jgi:hypothetical protein
MPVQPAHLSPGAAGRRRTGAVVQAVMVGPFPWPMVVNILVAALLLGLSLGTAGRPGRILAGVVLVTLVVSIGAGLQA